MKSASSFDRLVVCGLLLCLMSAFLTGCMAGAAVSVASKTVKTTAKVAGSAARITWKGAKAASHTISKPFREDEEDAPAK